MYSWFGLSNVREPKIGLSKSSLVSDHAAPRKTGNGRQQKTIKLRQIPATNLNQLWTNLSHLPPANQLVPFGQGYIIWLETKPLILLFVWSFTANAAQSLLCIILMDSGSCQWYFEAAWVGFGSKSNTTALMSRRLLASTRMDRASVAAQACLKAQFRVKF